MTEGRTSPNAPRGKARRPLGKIEKMIQMIISNGGWVRVESGTLARESRRSGVTLSAYRVLTLHAADGTLCRRLTLHQVESAIKKGILAGGKEKIPGLNCFSARTVVVRIGGDHKLPLAADLEAAENEAIR